MRSAFALRIFSGKDIYNFAFVALCGALQTHFHGRGRGGKRHLQRRLLCKRGAVLYDPPCEKGVQESPQTFLNPKIKNNYSAEHG